MPVVYLAFMADNTKKIVFIKDLRANVVAVEDCDSLKLGDIISTYEDEP